MQNSNSTQGPQRPAPIAPPPEQIELPRPRILTDCAEAYGQSSRRDAAVEWVVVHYTGVADVGARQIARNMAKKGAKTSTHYVVDPTGCYKVAPESKATWHVGNGKPNALYVGCTHAERWYKTIDPHNEFLGNRNSIGIELCVRKADPHSKSVGDQDWFFEPQTLDHAVLLIADICLRLQIPVSHVARHYDCTGKPCPRPFVTMAQDGSDRSRDEAWRNFTREIARVIRQARGDSYADA